LTSSTVVTVPGPSCCSRSSGCSPGTQYQTRGHAGSAVGGCLTPAGRGRSGGLRRVQHDRPARRRLRLRTASSGAVRYDISYDPARGRWYLDASWKTASRAGSGRQPALTRSARPWLPAVQDDVLLAQQERLPVALQRFTGGVQAICRLCGDRVKTRALRHAPGSRPWTRSGALLMLAR
jgi:hypothetical protein